MMWRLHVEIEASHECGTVEAFFYTAVGKTKREVKKMIDDWLGSIKMAGYTVVKMTSRLSHNSNGKKEPL